MQTINLREKCDAICEAWSPRIVGELNGQHVKVALLHGEFVWHHHDEADELFLVLRGSLRMKLRPAGDSGGSGGSGDSGDSADSGGEVEREVELGEGEMCIVPRGVAHLPIADEPCHVLLFEPAGTLNTGNVRSSLTVDEPERG